MMLGAGLTDATGARHEMLVCSASRPVSPTRMTLGYREATLDADGALGPAGTRLRGHEFHYATIVSLGDDPPFAFVRDPYGSAPERSGSRRGGVTGGFFHAIARA